MWIYRNEYPDLRVFGPIIIEDNCLIGANAHILPNVTIGKNSIIGTGSVVISDVEPDSIVMGIPARKLGSTLKYKQKCMEQWAIQRPPGFEFSNVKQWDKSKNQKQILQSIKTHLLQVFKDELRLSK